MSNKLYIIMRVIIMKKSYFMSLGLLFFAISCASPTVVNSVKPADIDLSCAQLANEMDDMDRFMKEADDVKGVTGGNIARAIFFWPSILGSYSNANEAIQAANARKVHISNIMREKKCPIYRDSKQ